ncbi:cdk10/11 [Perkinsela sp. CCAP 1560/4]|nr:cdk10/11 [Perkinsela sp. CCAP 1560/4]KNH08252.1 cdk10/11 [Perkinsela sp. CCAP 1560/4]|eukprot:KNH07166.1 cdk10/11 [Perkinsela sp. CCAP 1560/4]
METTFRDSFPDYDSLAEEDTSERPNGLHEHLRVITPSVDISKYEKLNTISEGSFGIVFRAKLNSAIHPGRFFAVKKLKSKYTSNKREGFSHSVLREINILRNCCHINIVKVIEICVDSVHDVYLVMEFAPTDIKSWQRSHVAHDRQLNMSHIKNVLRQLLHGVSYLHGNSLVHRDLKTSNLLITHDGVLKLCDFGLCRAIPDKKDDKSAWTPQVMTMLYRCPEVLMREQSLYSKAIDIWSVGIIFAELVLGHPPFVRCMKEPLAPDSAEAELEMFRELVDNLGPPSCIDEFCGNNYGRSLVSKSEVDDSSVGSLYDGLKSKLTPLGVDFLLLMLHWDPRQRPSATDALDHPFFAEAPLACANSELPEIVNSHAEKGESKDV